MPGLMAPWDGENANSDPGHRRPRRRRGRLRHGDRAELVTLRRHDVPVLPPGAAPLRVLHISDTHLTPGRNRLMSWVRSLDELDPDLVVNTGDSISHPEASAVLPRCPRAAARPARRVRVRLQRPVLAQPQNPARYLWRTSPPADPRTRPALGEARRRPDRGRLARPQQPARAADHRRTSTSRWPACTTRTSAGTATSRSRAGPTRPPGCASASCTHPNRRCSTSSPPTATTCCWPATPTAASCACPVYGALVTNCGIDRERARGLHRHPATGSLAARLRRSGHVAVGPGQVRLPPGGHPAHPDAARTALAVRRLAGTLVGAVPSNARAGPRFR